MSQRRKPGRPRKQHKVESLLFRFVSIEQIMDWCAVSRATAYRYKHGQAQPSKQSLKLFMLHQDGKILGPEWDGFCIKNGRLYDQFDKPLSPGIISAYAYMVQMANELKTDHPEMMAALRKLWAASV